MLNNERSSALSLFAQPDKCLSERSLGDIVEEGLPVKNIGLRNNSSGFTATFRSCSGVQLQVKLDT